MTALSKFFWGSLRQQLVVGMAISNAIILGLFVWDATERQKEMLLDRQTEYAVALAQSVATSGAGWLGARDFQGLREIVGSQTRYPDLQYAMILDLRGRIVAHTDSSLLNQYVLDLPQNAATLPETKILHRSAALVDVLSPVILSNRHIGWIRVGLTGQTLTVRLSDLARDGALYAAVSILISSVLISAIAWRLTRRLHLIHQTSDAIQAGDYSRRVRLNGTDEAASLSRAFDTMLDVLATRDRSLRKVNERLQAATRAGIVGIWEWDAATGKLFWDEVMCRLYGISPEQFDGSAESWLKALHPDDRASARQDVKAALSHQCEYGSEFRVVWPNGAIRHLKSAAQTIWDGQNKPLRMVGVCYDLSDLKRVEAELKRSNAELEQFAYAVSHDMRQPLRMVSSYLQLIEKALKDQLTDDTRQFLHFATDGARRMDGMILALLDFSRIGRKTEPMAELAIREALEEALAFLGPETNASAAQIDITGDWPRLIASRDEMVRLFQNLIGNALKYHQTDKAPKVEIVGKLQAKTWRCEIRDQGIGIDPSQISRLFQVFSRLQAQSRFEGVGVGLALCRKIVEHHAGLIGVESAGDDQGSTFWFELPLVTAAAQDALDLA